MNPELADLVAGIRREYPHCFACGTDNPTGLHMEPAELHDAEAVATFRPRHDHVGAADTVHGGLAATVLDEIMVWAGILVERVLTVTGTMELRYRRPLSVNDEIVARGTVTERRGRRLRCAGTLEVEGGPAVTATGLYLVVREFSASESATE